LQPFSDAMKKFTAFATSVIAAISLFVASGPCVNSDSSDIRPPAVAGQFYPGDPGMLKLAIQQFLKDSFEITSEKPIAIIAPHAGYIYSGQIIADAYRQAMKHSYDVVAILGVNHTTAGFRGVSLADYAGFRTPLGTVSIDQEVISALLKEDKDCVLNREVHAREHSIEIHLPFLQILFPKAKIVPAVIHPPDFEMCVRFGQALGRILKDRRALIVISTDLSHYPTYNDAVTTDRATLEALASLEPKRFTALMKNLDVPNLETRACGEAAIVAGVTAAKKLGAKRAVLVSYANSGDIALGSMSRVVGYGAAVLDSGDAPGNSKLMARDYPHATATPLQTAEKQILLSFARETIRRYLTTQTVPLARNFPSRLNIPQGAFVTLRKNGELRGCIGQVLPQKELAKTVGAMALFAAFNDQRFAPVSLSELNKLEIEVSVLTPMKPITSSEEIVVGRDGIVLSKAGKTAVFLPQVATENRWNRTEMLDNLCIKAGLATGCWKSKAHLQIFQAEVFSESQFE
jgi:AmmeMemoRadiSam system protein B/AmmeMemoRadiSam system protein A